ncbi:ribonuclease HI [Sulfurospirillum oryzae]|uniref:ribonuclease HI n=1 Tax=Sulfurospirillum oryzae TaxID=2976535 RepID=UPI0021E84DCA|nr:RNase H family protein [Sulfurospirillum oryzae]
MSRIWLFSDGSVNTQTHVGFGAYVIVHEDAPFDAHSALHVKVKAFTQTSSTKLELQTLLWALEEVKVFGKPIIIHTDSQNIIGLETRRERFERNGYETKQKRVHEHAKLYQAFYAMMDSVECSLVKVKGHKLTCKKDEVDRYFTLVDRAAREALRQSGL